MEASETLLFAKDSRPLCCKNQEARHGPNKLIKCSSCFAIFIGGTNFSVTKKTPVCFQKNNF